LESAEAEFRKALQLQPEHVGAMNNLARTLLEKARRSPSVRDALRKEATGLLLKAHGLEPGNKIALGELARAHLEDGKLEDAIGVYQKLIVLDTADLDSLIRLSEVREKKGDTTGAEAGLRQAIQTHANSGVLELALAKLLLRLDRTDEAKVLLSGIGPASQVQGSATKADEVYYEAQDELGRLQARAGNLKEARRIYEGLVALDPADYMAWEVLAAIDEQENKLGDAEQKYRRSLDVDRTHMSGWRGLARILLATGKRDEAEYAFRKADGFLATSPEQAQEFADELLRFGDTGWARAVLERAKILLAEQPKVVRELEEKLHRLGNTPDGGSQTTVDR
jgi:tetratricopeptide (TPR) repeat protein